jgi:hypothetical protein
MNLEKVQRHQSRKDIYNCLIMPDDSISKFDRFMIKQILYNEFELKDIA